jgi:hypothetical protein
MTMTSSGIDTTYNGWKNYETWNVSLYLQNDYGLYTLAQEWVQDRRDSRYDSISYDVFRHTLYELVGPETPDGVSWGDSRLDIDELTELLEEL